MKNPADAAVFRAINPWRWVPTLFMAQGMPYAVAMEMSVVMYKRMGLSNREIALYTSWLYLPWVIRSLWSPVVTLVGSKRSWIVGLQLCIAALFAGILMTLPSPNFFQWTLVFFWAIAFCAATVDIAIDALYLEMNAGHQAEFIGIRVVSYRTATAFGLGGLVILVGSLERTVGSQTAWAAAFAILSALFVAFALYHGFILPAPTPDRSAQSRPFKDFLTEFFHAFALFFEKKDALCTLAFVLLFRLDKAQLAKLMGPFFLDSRSRGGLGLSVQEVGAAFGIVGVAALMVGALAGGYAISRKGLRYWLWPMIAAIHAPGAVYLYLAYAQTRSLLLIDGAVALEQFGYGFGMSAYLMYAISVSSGKYKAAFHSICMGLAILGLMVPGMLSGTLQQMLGYKNFFLYALMCGIPGFVVAAMIEFPPELGIRSASGAKPAEPRDGELVPN
ncbi:MAG: MFS transporter [Elusimicrobiota bacterium]